MRGPFEAPWASLARNATAGIVALTIHAGAVYAILADTSPQVDPDDDAGPIAIELAPMPVAPPAPKLDVPIGPLAEEQAESPPVTPTQSEVAKTEEAPPLPTTPYEPDDPDLQMAKPSLKKDEVETPRDDKTTDAIEQPPSPASIAVPQTTAPAPVDEPPAPVAAAPDAGLSAQDRQIIARWQRKVVVHLNKFKRYPGEARRRGLEGDVRLKFKIDRKGRVVASEVATGSGSALLDRAALAILENSGLLPSPPPQVTGSEIDLTLPIKYRMRE